MELHAAGLENFNLDLKYAQPGQTAEEAQEIYPALEVVTLDEAGHNVRREAYDGYVAAVRAFLLRSS